MTKIWLSAFLLFFCFGSALASENAKVYVIKYANKYNVPVTLALQVAFVETKIRCGLTGKHGEKGPMQILPATARSIGFRNILTCEQQTKAGVYHLSFCWEKSKRNKFRTAACHNAGIGSLKKRMPNSATRYAFKVIRTKIDQ